MKFFKLLIRSILGFIFLAGISTLLGGLYLIYVTLWNTQVIQAYLPKPPEPITVMPVTLQLHGPRFVVAGDRGYFHAVTTGKTGKVTFSVNPRQAGMLFQISDNTVEFSALDEGEYIITAVVAGDGNQSAVDHIQFENLTIAKESDLISPDEEKPVHTMQQQMLQTPQLPPPPTAQELTVGALANVMSANKQAEALEVANAIYSVVRRLDSGLLASNADIPLEIEEQVKRAMRDKAGPWFSFTAAIDTIIEEYRRQGKITTAASQKPVLMEIANTLISVR